MFVPKMGTIVPIMGTAPPDRLSRLLFGSVRRDVLALLFGRPDERFYLREILRAAGGGSGAVQRELRDLVAAGLVQRQARGHQVYFSANPESPIFPELRSIVAKTAGAVDVLRAALAALVEEARIAAAFVYGSVARGSHSTGSDVDLIVVGDATLSEVASAIRPAEDRLGREINPSVYTAGEFRQRMMSSHFLKRVLAGPKLFIAGDERVLGRVGRQSLDRGAPDDTGRDRRPVRGRGPRPR